MRTKTVRPLCSVFALVLPIGCASRSAAIPDPVPVPEARPQPAVATANRSCFSLFPETAQAVLTAPLRWDRSDWLKLGIGVVAVGGATLLDDELRRAVVRNAGPTTQRIAKAAGPLGSEYSFGVLGGFYVAGKLLDDARASAVAEDGLASSLIAGGIITPVLKATIGRRRPSQSGGPFALGRGGASLPSGHTTQAFAVASVVAEHYDGFWVKAVAYGLAGLVGLSRMAEDAHYTSDVLAGALIGTFVGKAVVRLHAGQRLRVSAVPSVNPASPGVALGIRLSLGDP